MRHSDHMSLPGASRVTRARSVIVSSPNQAQRNRLTDVVNSMPEFRVVARTGDLMNTYNEVEGRLPKAVLIADVLACLPEFEVMRVLFSTLDVRWLVIGSGSGAIGTRNASSVSASNGSDLFSIPANATVNELAQNLLSLTRTPSARRAPARSALTSGLEKTVASAGATHGMRAFPAVPSRIDPDTSKTSGATRSLRPGPSSPAMPTASGSRNGSGLILIGSSTGGVEALLDVLGRFPENCPPTLIVQHTGEGFGQSLAALLDRQCRARVRLAKDNIPVETGMVIVGAGLDRHMIVEGARAPMIKLDGTSPVSGHLPSVDVLFKSALKLPHRKAAALLTGMGRDGAQGLKDLRNAGVRTIAQDEASSVVWGMPGTAVEMGGAESVLPLPDIGSALIETLEKTRPSREETRI